MSSRAVALFDLKHWFLNGIECCCCVAQIQTIIFLMLSSVAAI
jgi:hypothetical protein